MTECIRLYWGVDYTDAPDGYIEENYYIRYERGDVVEWIRAQEWLEGIYEFDLR